MTKQHNCEIKSKSPNNPVAGLWGFYSLLLTRLLSHSVKIGCIPIYIGIKGIAIVTVLAI